MGKEVGLVGILPRLRSIKRPFDDIQPRQDPILRSAGLSTLYFARDGLGGSETLNVHAVLHRVAAHNYDDPVWVRTKRNSIGIRQRFHLVAAVAFMKILGGIPCIIPQVLFQLLLGNLVAVPPLQ